MLTNAMKILPLSKSLFFAPAILAALVAGTCQLHADALNEKKILRKAGGKTTGEVTDIQVTNTDQFGMTTTFTTFDRSGAVKMPKAEGDGKSKIKHDGPEREYDTMTDGDVKKADVSRNGKKIKYVGKGEIGALPFEHPNHPFEGTGRATGKVRGKNVVTKGTVKGKRDIDDISVSQKVNADVKGEGKY